jgi:hypothetical protein
MKKFTSVTIYSIAMGYLEAALVIYIREMIFGNATQVFPLTLMEPRIAILEIVREAATILMLAMVGFLAGKERLEKWLMFIFAFAVWDIVYYIVLKIAVGWPASLLTFDVLFLIPVVWVGPVLAPLLIAALLGAASAGLLYIRNKAPGLRLKRGWIWIFGAGCAAILYSFTENIFHILVIDGPKGLENYTPKAFNWLLFFAGYLTMFASVLKTMKDSYQEMRSANPEPKGSNQIR